MTPSGILAVDVGGGTQDVLLWRPGEPLENACKLVMPSPTVLVADEIRRFRKRGLDVCLVGRTMGGGASAVAVREHLEAGLRVFALPEAALTFHDDLDRVRAMGVRVVDAPPPKVSRITLQDLDLERLGRAFEAFDIALPGRVAAAVQDHGFSPNASNRIMRFQYWKKLLDRGGSLRDWTVMDPPAFMTRMCAVQQSVPGAVVLDTGLAAVLGALLDPCGRQWNRDGLIVVNAGNFHTVAALVRRDRVYGVFEHHTELLDSERLRDFLHRFRRGVLLSEEVFEDNGHGCACVDRLPAGAFEHVLVTGPKRRRFVLPGAVCAAPFGDMMLTGCFGLLRATAWRFRLDVAIEE